MSEKILSIVGGDVKASVNALLRDMLTHGKVKGVLALQEVATGRSAFPVLVSDPAKLSANPFAPLMPVSMAKMVSRMTRAGPSNKPIAIVIRPCELRALIELTKLKQADLKNIVTIGIECPGTFPLNTFSSLPKGEDPTKMVLSGSGSDKLFRSACLSCRDPIPMNSDITLGIFGMDTGKEILVQANTEAGEKLIEGLSLTEAPPIPGREKAIMEARAARDSNREKLKGRGAEVQGIQKLSTFFETCINCHNCMKNCPICYCRECLFESTVLDMEADRYMSKAASKGIVKTPTDTLLFHVTRFNHMILSCVECGLCEQACPAGIPLMDIIIPIAENAQKEFEYTPGKDPKEPMPMVVYREEEFESIGE
jgi:formate dehydrogenase subunit beta